LRRSCLFSFIQKIFLKRITSFYSKEVCLHTFYSDKTRRSSLIFVLEINEINTKAPLTLPKIGATTGLPFLVERALYKSSSNCEGYFCFDSDVCFGNGVLCLEERAVSQYYSWVLTVLMIVRFSVSC
jgi:hypothetical protein